MQISIKIEVSDDADLDQMKLVKLHYILDNLEQELKKRLVIDWHARIDTSSLIRLIQQTSEKENK